MLPVKANKETRGRLLSPLFHGSSGIQTASGPGRSHAATLAAGRCREQARPAAAMPEPGQKAGSAHRTSADVAVSNRRTTAAGVPGGFRPGDDPSAEFTTLSAAKVFSRPARFPPRSRLRSPRCATSPWTAEGDRCTTLQTACNILQNPFGRSLSHHRPLTGETTGLPKPLIAPGVQPASRWWRNGRGWGATASTTGS